jgi:hypothetical protein
MTQIQNLLAILWIGAWNFLHSKPDYKLTRTSRNQKGQVNHGSTKKNEMNFVDSQSYLFTD